MHVKRSCGTTNEENSRRRRELRQRVKTFGEKKRPLRRRLRRKEDEKLLKPEKK